MPNLNGKGPEGLGPKTGMKLGKCKKTASDANTSSENRPYCNGRRNKKKVHKVQIINLKS